MKYRAEDLARGGGWLAERPQVPYLLPLLGFLAVMLPAQFAEWFGDKKMWMGVEWARVWYEWYPLLYGLKTVVAAVLLAVFWKYYAPIKWKHLGLGAFVGLVGVPVWVGVEYLKMRAGLPGVDVAKAYGVYDPMVQLPEPVWRYLYYVVRIGGPTLVVPVMEELFFRDFVERFLVRGARFEEVPVGTFTWFSFLGTAVLFGVNHGVMWPSGIIYGLMMGWLLVRTKSLGACMVAHGVTNLVLYAGYVVPTGDWQFMG